jgi:hypothetical protein
MNETTPSALNNVITIDDERIKNHLDWVVRGSVEETLNALLDAEADRLCNAQRYERSAISDACLGLAESAAEFFPDAAWQRCVVHWYRNIFSHVPSTKVREIAACSSRSTPARTWRRPAKRRSELLRSCAACGSREPPTRGGGRRGNLDLLRLP